MHTKINKLFTTVFCITVLSFLSQIFAQPRSFQIKSIPYELEMKNNAVSYTIHNDYIHLSAAGQTNLFNNPNGLTRVQNAPMLLFQPKGDFTLRAKVSGDLKSIYDVAALVIYQDENTWAKFCYENSVEKIPTIVSVVTRTYSDDCNSVSTGEYAYLSIIRKGNEFSFMYSPDNTNWKLIRYFHLNSTPTLKTGFTVHGSRGGGFTGIFTDIMYWDRALENMGGGN